MFQTDEFPDGGLPTPPGELHRLLGGFFLGRRDSCTVPVEQRTVLQVASALRLPRVSRVGSTRGQRLVSRASTVEQIVKKDVPLELEDVGLPMNTFKNKSPFKGKIVSVERIVGPKATGETCHIIIETNKEIPFVEGQSYGVIPPVSALRGGSGLEGVAVV